MIYTVNLNSSLDYIMRVGHLRVGETNRAERDSLVAGGKGVNVAKVLRAFGLPVKAFVVTAGFVGAEIERQLSAEGMDCAFFRTSGNSRINVKLKSDAETEINGRGEGVPDETVEDIAAALTPSPDWLVLSGNAPSGTRSDVYRRLASAAGGARVAVDAWGGQLRFALEARPFLVKPNLDELRDFFGEDIPPEEARTYAARMRDAGAANVLVSLGGLGAVLAAADGKVYAASAPAGRLVNSTGAGDSSVAGFIAACEKGCGAADALSFAVASGSACAFAEGFPSYADVCNLQRRVSVREV